MPTEPSSAVHSDAPEISTRVLQCPVLYLSDHFSTDVIDHVASAAGLSLAELKHPSRWISFQQFGVILQEVHNILGTEERFREACAYKINEAWGPLRYVLGAASPDTIMKLVAKTINLVSAMSHFEILKSERSGIRLRYTTDSSDETRLICVSRQTSLISIPTLWGLPAAQLKEEKCVAWGHDACIYDLKWLAKPRRLQLLLGGLVGVFLVIVLGQLNLIAPVSWIALPALGAAIGLLFELVSTYRTNLSFGEQVQTALEQVAHDEAEARQEITEFSLRQKQWTQLLEEQVQERTQVMQDVVARIQRLREERVVNLQGFSHDLRNPLAVLKLNADYLRDHVAGVPDGPEVLDDMVQSAKKMEQMLMELMNTASSDTALIRLTPERIETGPLVERLRRRMRALVHGRDIRVSVFATRESPTAILTDPLLLDRVLDNLMTNAAKYTERGSVVIEIDGTPDYLVIKISDTGRGIAEQHIERIFSPGGSDKATRSSNSFGVGLSVVVKLLAEIGGKLDVMSKVNQGTTFWAHFPLELKAHQSDVPEASSPGTLLPNVVRIRRSNP
jgi:signal transduction histidine kinase